MKSKERALLLFLHQSRWTGGQRGGARAPICHPCGAPAKWHPAGQGLGRPLGTGRVRPVWLLTAETVSGADVWKLFASLIRLNRTQGVWIYLRGYDLQTCLFKLVFPPYLKCLLEFDSWIALMPFKRSCVWTFFIYQNLFSLNALYLFKSNWFSTGSQVEPAAAPTQKIRNSKYWQPQVTQNWYQLRK